MADTWGTNDKPVTQDAATPSTEKWGEGDSMVGGKGFAGHARDAGLALAKGIVAVPEAIVGLADIATGGRAGKFLENADGAVGFRPKQAKEFLGSLQTDQSREQMRQFDEADGIVAKAGVALSNPSMIGNAVVESVPSMLAGGALGRGALAAGRGFGAVAAPTAAGQAARQAAIAGGVGEGAAMAGSQAEQIRQGTDDGLLTGTQAGLAAATGIAGGAIGALAGKVANRLGVGDAETMMAQGGKGLSKQIADDAATAAVNPLVQQQARSIPTQMMLGAMTEGLLEELPQSVMEQVFQNIALGQDWYKDVDAAVVLGTLSGGTMGAGAAGYRGFREPRGAASPTGQQAAPNAAGGRPPESESARALRSDILSRLSQVQQEEAGEPVVPQTAPPDGATALAQQRARMQAEREAGIAASRAELGPEDEILHSTGAADFGMQGGPVARKAPISERQGWGTGNSALAKQVQAGVQRAQEVADQAMKPSERMGLNPNAGALSAAAVVAVDSGATDQMLAAQTLGAASDPVADQANAEIDALQYESASPEDRNYYDWEMGLLAEPEAELSLVNLNDDDIPWDSVSNATDDEFLRQLGATDQEINDAIATANQSSRANSSPSSSAAAQTNDAGTARPGPGQTQSAEVSVAQRIAQLEKQAAEADAEASDWSARVYKPNAKGLPSYEAAGGPADVQEANEQRRLKAIADAKGRAVAARAEAEALRNEANAVAQVAGKADKTEGRVPVAATSSITPAPAGGINAVLAKTIPDMTDAEIAQAIAHLGPNHARTSKLQKAQQTRGTHSNVATNKGAINGPQAQQAAGTPPVQPTNQGLTNASTPVNNGPQAAQPAGAQAQAPSESKEQRAQRVAGAGAAWTRMPAAEREALASRATLNPIVKKNAPRAQWADLNVNVQRKLADAMEPQAGQPADMQAFAPETGTLGIPRAEMPQVPTQSHGGLVKHLNAQGIAHETTMVDAAGLKPTQAEYSPAKVEQAKTAGGDRAVIVSSDGHIIDGHHQALAAAEEGKQVKVIVLDAPVEQALDAVRNSPSAATDPGETAASNEQAEAGTRASRAKAHKDERPGDVELDTFTPSFLSMDEVIALAREHMHPNEWSRTFQLHRVLDIHSKDWNRVSKALTAARNAEPAEAEKPAAEAKADQFAGNKVFTADAVAAARARMKSKLGRLNSGLDPELMMDGMTIAGAYIESGMRNFGQYAKAMVEDMGDGVTPYLLSFWEAARNFPGVDTTGMTDVVQSSNQHKAMLSAKVKEQAAEAVGTEAPAPAKRTKKTGAKGDMMLTQDWGVEHINGYGESSDREGGNETKDAFLKETRNYLNAVAAQLEQSGFLPHAGRNGKAEKLVSVNESGVAGSGDVSLTMQHPDTGTNVYVTISDTSLRGVVPSTPSGIAIMYRAATGSDRYAAKGGNTWAPVNLSANDLAALVSRRATSAGSSETRATADIGSAAVIAPSASASPAQATSLAQSLVAAIESGNMPKDNPALKKLVEAFDGKPADQVRMKDAQEQLETAIAMVARKVVAKNEGDRSTFDILLRVYESQPNLNIRTSTSIANQAYSTPAPLAFLASRLAGITRATVVHEPTAGTGMLLIGSDPKKALVNELNDLRISALEAQGFKPTQKDAATQLLVPEGKRPDAVVTNPPFGSVKNADGKPVKVKVDGFSIGQIDHLIAARALQAMKDDGRATLILGANKVAGGLSTDDRIFFNWLYSHFNVAGHFEIEGDLYTRQGAGWPVRVITINGRQQSGKLSPVAGTIKRADNWEQVYEHFNRSLQGAAAQQSASTSPAPDRAGGIAPSAVPAPAAPGGRGPQSSTGSAGNVAGASLRAVPDLAVPAVEPVGRGPDEQRLNAQPYVPQPKPGQGDVGAVRPAQLAGTAALDGAEAPGGNEFQAPYTPRSERKDEGVLIPANMAQPTQDALSRLEDEVGNIDEFARDELGYDTVEDLHNALMGLQVDSVATAIYQIKRGKAVVIADQTGIGKGRQAASIIRWAARQGMTPVFVSVKPSLFTDMYGDLADIGTHDVNPFIMNSDAWVAGEDGAKLFANKPSGHKNTIQRIADSGQLPAGSNALFMTYSQINLANVQRQALMALAPNAVFVLDESHNAAGASATGEFMIGALDAAKGVTYLSATYAKRPDNMPLYFKTDIGDAAADSEGLAAAMAAGGLPLQTVVSNNLVKAGQMFRRERSYDGVSIASTFDTPNRDLHERLSNEATKALRAIVSADTMFHEVYVKELSKEMKENGSVVQDSAGNQLTAGVQHTEFSSVVHNFVKQMLLGLKAQSAADEAIASLKRGEKPIIAVENTMGSFLTEYAAANGIGQGDSLGSFDYRTVLTRALDRSRVIIEVSPTGDKMKKAIPLSALDARTRNAYDSAQKVIDGLALEIPVSPIDWMRAEIVRAGYGVAEITGRNLTADYSDPTKPALSAIDLTEQKDKVNTTRLFNSGKLDALILNVAGSTGISLHASEKFEDQRQRHMIVAQAAGDINIFMQMLGRVHRTGQVRLPKYTILSVDLPTEKRPTAVLSIKMKSLNANTSSNTESATSVKSADILNKYGDQIVNQYLVDNYSLARELGLEQDIGDEPQDDIARKATGRLALQPIETQHSFYDEVEAQYTALIDYLNKTNQNDLEPRTFDFDAKEVRQEVLFEGPNPETPFGEDAIYGEYSIKAQGTPMTPEEIKAAIAESLDGKASVAHADAMVSALLQTHADQANANRVKNGLVPGNFDEVKYTAFLKGLYGEDGAAFWVNQAKLQIANGVEVKSFTPQDMAAGKDSAAGIQFIKDHAVGTTFRVDINSEPFNAIVTNIRSTHKATGNPFSMSKIQVTVAVNGALRSLSIPATQFRKIEVSSIAPAFKVEQLFKEQPPNQRETAKIVTGNLLAAYGELQGVRGTIITFTKQDGTSEQGILLPKLFDYSKNTRGDYRLEDGAAALNFLQKSDDKDIGRFGIMSRDGVVRVLPAGQGVRVQVPKSKLKGGKYFLDKGLIAAGGDFVSQGSFMVSTAHEQADAVKVLDLLMKKQALYALPSMAEEAKALSRDKSTPPASFSREMSPDLAQQLLRIMGQAPEYSPAARSQAVAKVRQTVDAIRSAWANGPEVVVAFDMNDPAIPDAARAEDLKQRSGGAAGTPEGFYWKGKVYLLSSQLNTPNDAARVLFHEALGHHGLRGAFGKDLDNILNQVVTMRRADVDAKIKEYGLRGVSDLDRRTAAEEVLAEMAQATPELHFVKRAVAAIRNWLRANVPGFRSLAMSDADIIQAFILPARRFVEQGARPQAQGLALAFSRSAMKSVDANIARGRAALARALTEKNTVHRAMFRTGMGWVDFVWGAEGVVKASGRTKGAMGLSHILEARQRKDGLNEQQTVQLLSRMVDVIAVGKEVRRVEFAGLERVTLEYAYVQAILTKQPGSNAWLVSGWELVDSGASGAGNVAPAATVNAPTTAQRIKVSESDDSIANDGGSGNLMFSRAKLAGIKAKALDQIHQTLSHPGTVSMWDKSVGTMRNLAERVPAFKPVFEAAQRFIDDVSTLANEAADAAPRLLPRVDSWKDLKKQPISAADNKAVAAPVFEGTLMWGRDVDGTAVLVDALAKKYANLPADEKAQLLLRAGRLDDRVLKMWRGLPVEMYEANINARFESQMLKAGLVWTDAELKSIFKANNHQISLYREARAGIDKSIDITSRADMLRALGEDFAGLRDLVMDQATLEDAMKVITDVLQQENRSKPDADDRIAALNNMVVTRYEQSKKLMDEGYAPLMRFGQYTIHVKGQDGESIYFGMYESQRESNLAKLALAQEFRGATITQGTMSKEEHKLYAGITPESLEQFGNMLGLGSQGDSAQDKAFQAYLQKAKNNHSALKRLIHRKGTAGYSEDIGRVLASFVYSNARMAAGGLNAGRLESAIEAIPKEEGKLRDVAMGLRSYIQDPQEEGQAVRGMLFAQYLGGSLASAMVNMTQPFAVTMPWLSQYGGMKKASGQMARALNDMRKSGMDKNFKYEPDLVLALQAAQDDGTVSPQEVHQLMAQARGAGGMRSGDGTRKGDALAQVGNTWEKAKVAWGQPFALAEQFNRRSTFIAAYRTAKEQGMASPAEFARKAVLETQFLYSKANKMRWARGAVGGTLLTFKTYSVSYLELMHRTWNAGKPGSPERAAGRRAVGWAVVMLMLMGGAGGLPFMEDAEDLIDGAGQLMGYNFSLKQERKDFMREWIGKELAEFLESGLSGLPGAPIDVSGRLGMGNLIPGTGLALSKQSRERDLMELAGPAGDLVTRGFTGLRKLLTGDIAGAAVEVSPTAVRNALKGADMAASGIYKDTKGYKVIDTTLAEAASKFLGFQPRSVAEVQEANSFMQRSKSFYSQSSSEIKAQWADALFRKDDADLERVRERLAAWNRDNPDQPIIVKMPDVWKKVREMGKDRTQRIADTAPKALRAQMREAAHEVGR